MTGGTEQFESFVGVDLHKHTVTLVAVGPDGGPIARAKFSTKCVLKIHQWLLELPRPCRMAVEADGFVEWFIDVYGPAVERIDLADAGELARLRGKRRKTDFNDALDIAVRLARGDCPLGWIADPDVLALRKLGRHWHQLSRILSRTKQMIKSILNAANLPGPQFDSVNAQKWFLTHGLRLKPQSADAFEDFIELLGVLDRQRKKLKLRIILANRSERFQQITHLLMTVPGIKNIWACIIAAEIGDFARFPNADALEFWAGLTPDTQESAGRTQSGPITKAGSRTLRWALGKAAMALSKADAGQEAIRQRLIKRVGGLKPKANVAMARRRAHILFAMVRNNEPYHVIKPRKQMTRANQVRLRKRKTVT
jgi:transposase